jgi:tetratricopeptide (TPR) repeat protein
LASGCEPVMADARVRLREIQSLFDRAAYAQAIAGCQEVVERFADEDEPGVRERVAYARLLEGLSLARLGRREQAIAVYDDLIARYGGSTDAKTGLRVAWALSNRGVMLKRLGRREEAIAAYDELIARAGRAREPELRLRTSWGLWNKGSLLEELSRSAEADSVYEQLIERHDEGLDGELDRKVGWRMAVRARKASQSGDTRALFRLCDELVERFGDASDPGLQLNVLGALSQRAAELERLGRDDEALATYEEIVARFGDATNADLRERLAATLTNKALRMAELGRGREAIAAYDEALALLDGASEPQLRDRAVEVLLSKGQTLWRLDREEEALVVYNSALSAYNAARAAGGGTDALWAAVLTLFYKLGELCALGRSEEAGDLRAELVGLLGDVGKTTADSGRSQPRGAPEAELAAVFADVLNRGDCWRTFEGAGEERPQVMAERAIELYRLTEPWALPTGEQSGLAAHLAASMLRDIADGYAMLASPSTPAERSALPLPQRGENQRTQLIRRFGVDGWAADLGHPLALPESAEHVEPTAAPEQQLEQARSLALESASSFARFFLVAAHTHDLLVVLCDSPTGRDALQDQHVRSHATRQIADARKWVRRLMPHLGGAAGATAASVLIAQAFFLASHAKVSSSADLYPTTPMLRDLLRENETYAWLSDQELELPPWITEDDD